MRAGQPFTRTSSLIETGTPSIGDSGLPFFQRCSEARGGARAWLGIEWQRALTAD